MPRKLNIIFHALQLGILIFALITLPLAHDLFCQAASAQGLGEHADSSDSDSKPEHSHDACSEGMSEPTHTPDDSNRSPGKSTLSCCVPSIVGLADIQGPYGGVVELAVKVSLSVPEVMRGIDHQPLEEPPRFIG
jgi:hypothetical protein